MMIDHSKELYERDYDQWLKNMDLISDSVSPGPYWHNRFHLAIGGKIKHFDMPYSEFLKTEEWKETRNEVMVLGPKCWLCKKRKAIEVHHQTYEFGWIPYLLCDMDHRGYATPPLIPICKMCHTEIHM